MIMCFQAVWTLRPWGRGHPCGRLGGADLGLGLSMCPIETSHGHGWKTDELLTTNNSTMLCKLLMENKKEYRKVMTINKTYLREWVFLDCVMGSWPDKAYGIIECLSNVSRGVKTTLEITSSSLITFNPHWGTWPNVFLLPPHIQKAIHYLNRLSKEPVLIPLCSNERVGCAKKSPCVAPIIHIWACTTPT